LRIKIHTEHIVLVTPQCSHLTPLQNMNMESDLSAVHLECSRG
jgi:hypothetical protein